MDRINLPASIQNVVNVEKVHQRDILTPLNNTIINSMVDQERFDDEQHQTTEAEASGGVRVDPDEQRRQERKKKKDEKKKKPDGKNHGRNSGKFIDYTA